MGKYFTVQEIINREIVRKSISNIYGGNRATDNAIDSVVPMFIESGFFTRPKAGLYQHKDKLIISSSVTKQIYIESFKSYNKWDRLQEYQLRDPYFLFIND